MFQSLKIRKRRNAARCCYFQAGLARQQASLFDVGTHQHSVARHIRIDNAFDSGLRDDAGEFGSANLSSLFPAAHHDLTVFGIDAYSNSITAKVTHEICHSFRRFHCQCADDRSPHSEFDHFFHIFSSAQATAELNRYFNCSDNLTQQISVR